MQNLFNGLSGISQVFNQEKSDKTFPGTLSSIVTGTTSISKMIFGKGFGGLNIPLPYHIDIWKVIFSKLNFYDLQNCSHVSKECYKLANDPVFSKEVVFDEFCFNPWHWNKYCGDGTVSNEEIDKALKLLPKNINEILKSPCPAFPDKRIMDTHMLVWIPEAIKGKKLTINSFGGLLNNQLEFANNPTGYREIWHHITLQIGDNQIKSGWVLMTTDVISGSRNNFIAQQQEMIENLNTNISQTHYRLPKAGEAIVCIMAYYLRSKKRLFSDEPRTFTRCLENTGSYRIVLGDFALSGLVIDDRNTYANDATGVAALWEL